jgi:hypothetical protein
MGRVLESNALIAERMSIVETSIARSAITRRDDECTSVLSQQKIRVEANPVSILDSADDSRYIPVRHAFEEDLRRSWVYQRAARDSRPLSFATSTQLTQSWSVFSGVSLSAISNIAVYALPIYESDLQNSILYRFGGKEEVNAKERETGKSNTTRKGGNKMAVSNANPIGNLATYNVRLADKNNLQNDSRTRGLQHRERFAATRPSVRDRIPSPSLKVISEPTLISSSSTQWFYDSVIERYFPDDALNSMIRHGRSIDPPKSPESLAAQSPESLAAQSPESLAAQSSESLAPQSPESSVRDGTTLPSSINTSPSQSTSYQTPRSIQPSIHGEGSPETRAEDSVRSPIINLRNRMEAYGGRLGSPTSSKCSSSNSARSSSEAAFGTFQSNCASNTSSVQSTLPPLSPPRSPRPPPRSPPRLPPKNFPLPVPPLPFLRQVSYCTLSITGSGTTLTRPESGYPYLRYNAGEVSFDVSIRSTSPYSEDKQLMYLTDL